MEQILPLLFLPFLFFAFALITNLYREHRQYRFQLKPNCLLTRNPIVFITGPRSIFYFRKYWNAYPEVLAEHGYNVFTLHLPWRGPERLRRMTEFLQNKDQTSTKYHFICDEFTASELKEVFDSSAKTASLTVLKEDSAVSSKDQPSSIALAFAYRLHTWACRSLKLPTAHDLGLQFPHASSWLLQRMQERGEQDFLS
ncbi:hypothetical protein [Bdellovibrio sp. HCB337]|uniref:hypothetical protein n=1 Tax=Bdellovibrio sp. HCB337 TaxID=3394358 RepID=UPI0039A6F09E